MTFSRVLFLCLLVSTTFMLVGCGSRRPAAEAPVAKKPSSDLSMGGNELQMPASATDVAARTVAVLPELKGRGKSRGGLDSAWSAAGEEAAPSQAAQPRLRSLMEGDDWMSAPSATSSPQGADVVAAPRVASDLTPPSVELPSSLTSTAREASPWEVAPTTSSTNTPTAMPDLMASTTVSVDRLGVDPGAADAIGTSDSAVEPPVVPDGDRQGVKHKVRQWENLWALAQKYGVSSKAIVAYNHLADPNHIWVGQTLYIPTKEEAASVVPSVASTPRASSKPATVQQGVEGQDYHLVLRGESLSAIARKYGCSVRKLAELNELVDPSRIYAGMRIGLPRDPSAPRAVPGGGVTSFTAPSYSPSSGMPDVMTP